MFQKQNRKTIIGKLLFISLFGIITMVLSVQQISYASWIKDEEGIRYEDEDGNIMVGFQEIDGKTYYFNENGYLKKGKFFCENDQNYYYADKHGVIRKNTIQLKKGFYIADEDGKIQNGFVEHEGERYFFDGACNMVRGWFKSDGNWYYANADGVIQTGFITLDTYRYYLKDDGSRVSDAVLEIDGKTYVFNEDGSVDENATAMYSVFCCLNTLNDSIGKKELSQNSKVQACAMLRATALTDGFQIAEGQEQDLERLLKSRGIKCSGGYEFSYGGVEGYGIEALQNDLQRDWNLLAALKDEQVCEVGLGMYVEDDISYYDIIFICK
ncbi:MAG: hypothetical protein Q4D51_09820 [Eubacteriales bacterium]|nr:hypothetical protein [Eubacteriales bacterium]